MEKMEAHHKALLHRAISVFVFNSKGELLLQQRATNKYHSGALWTNTCCTHPRPGEPIIEAAKRRLIEEMGLSATLDHQFGFIYKAVLGNKMTEYEFDHIFFGTSDDQPQINADEVADWRYLSLQDIAKWIEQTPEQFTEWFKLIFNQINELRK
jgi:isopentenyl-diphosphate delta-isomerase